MRYERNFRFYLLSAVMALFYLSIAELIVIAFDISVSWWQLILMVALAGAAIFLAVRGLLNSAKSIEISGAYVTIELFSGEKKNIHGIKQLVYGYGKNPDFTLVWDAGSIKVADLNGFKDNDKLREELNNLFHMRERQSA